MHHIQFTIFLLHAALCMLFSHVMAQDRGEWPIFRGDYQLRGNTNAAIEPPLKLAWTYEASDAIKSAPVSGHDMIYVGCVDGTMHAVDLRGNGAWHFETDNGIEAPALYRDGTVYFGNLSGHFYALNAEDGDMRWMYEAENQIMGSANLFEQDDAVRIIFGSYDYYLHCVDATRGQVL